MNRGHFPFFSLFYTKNDRIPNTTPDTTSKTIDNDNGGRLHARIPSPHLSSSSPDTTSLHLAEETRAARINALHFIVLLLLTRAMDDYDGRLSVDRRLVKLITNAASLRSLARKSGMIIIKSLIKGKYQTKREARSHFQKYLKQKQKNAIRADVIRQKRARRANKSSHRCNNQIVFSRVPILVGVKDKQERDWAIDVTGLVDISWVDEGEGKWDEVAGGAAEGDEAPTYDSGDGGGGRGGVILEPSSPQPHDGGDRVGYREHVHLGREEERCRWENPNERCGRVPFCPTLRYDERIGVRRQATQPRAYSSRRQAGADDDGRVVQGEGGERGGSDDGTNERCGGVLFGVRRQATQPRAYTSQRQACADDDWCVVQGEGGERGGSDGTNERCGRSLQRPAGANDDEQIIQGGGEEQGGNNASLDGTNEYEGMARREEGKGVPCCRDRTASHDVDDALNRECALTTPKAPAPRACQGKPYQGGQADADDDEVTQPRASSSRGNPNTRCGRVLFGPSHRYDERIAGVWRLATQTRAHSSPRHAGADDGRVVQEEDDTNKEQGNNVARVCSLVIANQVKSPASLSTWLSEQDTPQRNIFFSAILSNVKNVNSINNVIVEPADACRSLNFITPARLAINDASNNSTTPIHPFDHNKPNILGGRHRSIGRDISTFNLRRSSNQASYRERNKLINAYQKTGNSAQRRYTLQKFLTHKSIIADTKHVLQGVPLNKEAESGIVILRTMKKILKTIFSSSRGRIGNTQRAWVNVISMCLFSDLESSGTKPAQIGKMANLSYGCIKRYSSKVFEKARLIQSGDKKGYELIEADQDRSKYSEEELAAFDNWILKDCQYVIENPLKNDTVMKRDRKGNVVMGDDNLPLQIQKRLLMCSYRELHLDMIDNFKGMITEDGEVRYSEVTIRKLMPNHVKKAGDRYKQMCGCQTCVIFKDMYQNVRLWRKKFINRKQLEIDGMISRSRARTTLINQLEMYKGKVLDDDGNTVIPERAWDAAAQLACPKVELAIDGNDDSIVRCFHKFGCVMGECNACPKWHSLIPAEERECTDYIKYCIYGCYSQCSLHGQRFIGVNAMNIEYCMECERRPITAEEQHGRKIPRMQKKYIRQEKTEPMNEFMALGGTYHKHITAMLYHSFLVVMLGSTVLAKNVAEAVKTNDNNLLFRRDHSERYTPRQTGEIMSEGIGTDGDVSIEGATLMYKIEGSATFRKILYASLSDDKKQDASTVRCNIEHVFNDLEERGELNRANLNGIYDIVDGCAVQYRCATVLYVLSQLSTQLNTCYTRNVQAPGHGKEEVDGLIGTDKTYADMIFARPGRYAEEEEADIKASKHRMNSDGVKMSLAEMVYDILRNSKRKFRLQESERKIVERRYHLRPVDAAQSHNVKMKAKGFDTKIKRSGIGSHYCFRADPMLGPCIAARRFFCECSFCANKFSSPNVSDRYSGPLMGVCIGLCLELMMITGGTMLGLSLSSKVKVATRTSWKQLWFPH